MPNIATQYKQRLKKYRTAATIGPPHGRVREQLQARERVPAGGTYRWRMPRAQKVPSDDLRLVRFGRFVNRVLEAAASRGMTIKQIEEAAGVGKSTIYRWRDGEVLPKVSQVRAFCEGLGAPITEAYAALGWSEDAPSRPRRPEPLIDDPDLRLLLRKLTSPNTPPAEKLWIRRQIKALAAGIEEHPEQE